MAVSYHLLYTGLVKVRYTYKLRPGSGAVRHLRHEYSLCRWVWNESVHQFRSGNRPTAAKLDKMLTAARRSASWLRAGSSVVQQQVIRDYSTALHRSFTVPGTGRPSFRHSKRDRLVSLNYTRRGFSLAEGRLRLAGGVSVPVVWSRDLPAEPSSVRVYEDAAGWWWASFVVEVADDYGVQSVPADHEGIGVDWGVSTSATTTDPDYDLPYRQIAARQAAKVKRYSRQMAMWKARRDAEEERLYRRARRRKAKAERRARFQRQEHARRWARRIARDHEKIAVEDFKPKFLAKTSMSRKAHDAALSQCKRALLDAGRNLDRQVVLVPPAYTTMTCSSCGRRANSRLPLSKRTFRCGGCGYEQDRDRNAAMNIYRAGFNPAPDDGVRPDAASATAASQGGIPRL